MALEGLLALPRAAGPVRRLAHPLLVFLHGGPVGALACGEHPDLSAWAASGWAVFMPDFRSSGIAGRDEMRRAFRRRGLPGQDPEIGDVLSGVDLLTAQGLADPGALVLFGHSYGGYLAGRIIGRDHRFRVAVCCEAVADLRLLDPESQRMQASWAGGDPEQLSPAAGRRVSRGALRRCPHARAAAVRRERHARREGQAWTARSAPAASGRSGHGARR